MRQLLTLHPAVGTTATSRHGDVVTFSDAERWLPLPRRGQPVPHPKGRWQGSQAGASCTVFPFNSFSRIQKTVVVSPHFLCPLRLQVPARPGEVDGSACLDRDNAPGERAAGPWLSRDGCPPSPLASIRGCQIAARRARRASVTRARWRSAVGPSRKRSRGEVGRRRFVAKPSSGRAAHVMGLPVPSLPQPRDVVDDLLLGARAHAAPEHASLCPEGILRALAPRASRAAAGVATLGWPGRRCRASTASSPQPAPRSGCWLVVRSRWSRPGAARRSRRLAIPS